MLNRLCEMNSDKFGQTGKYCARENAGFHFTGKNCDFDETI